jgi:hypothetical protein
MCVLGLGQQLRDLPFKIFRFHAVHVSQVARVDGRDIAAYLGP